MDTIIRLKLAARQFTSHGERPRADPPQRQPTKCQIQSTASNVRLRHLVLYMATISLIRLESSIVVAERMVRLCIASVDPVKLSSQCVMCNRREFPLTVIDCTGITKVNDLIANPLSVQEATCLIYNCRRVSRGTVLTHNGARVSPKRARQ